MKIKELIKELFERIEWKIVYSNTGKAYHSNMFIGTEIFDCRVVLKVSTNKKWQRYKCYFTNGAVKDDLPLKTLVENYPDAKFVLQDYNIEYE